MIISYLEIMKISISWLKKQPLILSMVSIKDMFIINQWLIEIKIKESPWYIWLLIKKKSHYSKIILMKFLFTHLSLIHSHSLVPIKNTLPTLLNMLNVILTKLNSLLNKDFCQLFYHILSKLLWMILNNVSYLIFSNHLSDQFNLNLFVP